MKKTILLFFTFLSLSSVAPLCGYQLGQTFLHPVNGNAPMPTPSMLNEGNTPPLALMPTPSPLPLPSSSATPALPTQPTPSPSTPIGTPSKELAPFLIYDTGTGEIQTVPVRDYLIGAVASEMPMTWPDDALKAQAIATHSYILYCKENSDLSANQGAYLQADPARRQGFMTDPILQSYWGTSYHANYERLSKLVDEVLDMVVTYENKPAATSYFAISNTKTENSEAVWGEAIPYLTSVDSVWDAKADGYVSCMRYSKDQVYQILQQSLGISPGNTLPEEYFANPTQTDAGYVATIDVCGTPIAGTVLRSAFSLRSSCFTIAYNNGTFEFTTAGYGHGVGLSQWGAYYQATIGEDYRSILAHYFPETAIGSASMFE